MLNNIHIQNYRGIKDLKINDFKRINLLVGDNNSGKSSVLEAIGLVANRSILPIFNFDSLREIGLFADLSKINLQDQRMWDNLEYLVYEKNLKEGFSVEANLGIKKIVKLHAHFSNEAQDFSISLLPNSEKMIINQNLINSFIATYTTNDENPIKLGFSRNGRYDDSNISAGIANIIPSTTAKAFELIYPMKKVAKENGEKFFSDLTQEIDPKIKAIKTAGDEVLADIGKISIPLKYMGDGLINVLNILLKIRELKNGILLIDEIENGLHWKTQKILWREIIKACKKNDVQIIATTHSYDTVKALSEVYEEEGKSLIGEDEIRLFQLFNKSKNFTETLNADAIKGMIKNHYEPR